MQLISVNIGVERAIARAKASGKTGIYKLPAAGDVPIRKLGIPTDVIVDTKNHGGYDQAIYIYGALDYDWWSKELGRELAPGTFGENLTISDLESADVSQGDQIHVGSVILEVTYPRIPCVTLSARMGDPQFIKRFRDAERPGLYCRVLQEGTVKAGDQVAFIPAAGEAKTMREIFKEWYRKHK